MPRLQPVPARSAGRLVGLASRYARRRFGAVPEPFGVMTHAPAVLWANAVHESMVERSWTRLDRALREIAVLRAALTVDCPWCVDFGTHLSEQGGVPRAKLEAVADWRASELFSPLERQVLDYAEALSETPLRATDAMVADLERDLGADGVVELTAYVALENSRSRFNAALGIGAQGFRDGDFRDGSCRVPASR